MKKSIFLFLNVMLVLVFLLSNCKQTKKEKNEQVEKQSMERVEKYPINQDKKRSVETEKDTITRVETGSIEKTKKEIAGQIEKESIKEIKNKTTGQTEKQSIEEQKKEAVKQVEKQSAEVTGKEITKQAEEQNTENTEKETTELVEKQSTKEAENQLDKKDEKHTTGQVEQIPDKWKVPAKYKNMKNPVEADKESLSIGKTLYAKHCKSCHGKTGEGDGPKAGELDVPCGDFTTEEFQSQTDGELFYKTIEGNDNMPSYKKKIPDKEDIWLIVNYLRTLSE